MLSTSKKYSLQELSLGMEVTKESLSEIYDTWIILLKKNITDKVGEIAFIGKTTNSESDKLFNGKNIITPIYNSSMDLDGDISYDE